MHKSTNKRLFCLLLLHSMLLSTTLFAGKITIVNDTKDTTVKVTFGKYQVKPIPNQLGFFQAPRGSQGLTVAPGKTETFALDGTGFSSFNFYALSGPSTFKVKGSLGEEYTADTYKNIDVPEIGQWTLWIQ